MKRIINPNNWIEIAIDKGQEKDNIKIELIRFWNEFYNKYLEINKKSNGTQDEEKTKSILNDDDSSQNQDDCTRDDSTHDDSTLEKSIREESTLNQDDSTQTQEKSTHNEEDSSQNAKKTINKSIKKNKRGNTKSELYKQEVFNILHY